MPGRCFSPFRQRIRIEVVLQNTSNQPLSDIACQWVAVVMTAGSAQDQYTSGTESNITLQPFEAKTIYSDPITTSGVTNLRYGMVSGTKMRGHYVKLSWQGQCVFKTAQPPEMEQDAETYLAKLEKAKKPARNE